MKGTQVLRNFEGIGMVHSALRKAHAGFGPRETFARLRLNLIEPVFQRFFIHTSTINTKKDLIKFSIFPFRSLSLRAQTEGPLRHHRP